MWQRVWIWKRNFNGGKSRYYVRWYDRTGRMRSESAGPDRKRAERMRSEKEIEINSSEHDELREISFEGFKEEELRIMGGQLAAKSVLDLEQTLRIFRDMMDVKMLSDVSPGVVENYVAERLANVGRATVNKNIRTLKASLSRAVKRGYLRKNPVSGVQQVREYEKEIRVLSTGEVEKLLEACLSEHWEAFISLAVTTGMRRGEMLALRWQDVDFNKGRIWVRNTPDHRTKSGKNRVLPLTAETSDLMRQLPRNGPMVFHTSSGKPWHNNLQRSFHRIVKRAGIDYCSIHDLRRTFISHLAMAGVNAAVVKELAGHASIQTTQKYYTRILPESLQSAAEKLPFGQVIGSRSICTESAHRSKKADSKEKDKIVNLALFVG